ALLKLRCAEDLFAIVAYRRVVGAEVEPIREAMLGTYHLEWALQARARLVPGSRAGRRLKFRVVARMAGEHEFRRVDLKRAVENGLVERGDHAWRLDEDQAEVEIWAMLNGDEFIAATRLSGDRLRHRGYKLADRPGSLRPAVAAALAWLSDPHADDVVLDPVCGVGTILIERAELGRYRLLLGGDHDPEALAAARTNVGPRYKPIELRAWDAAALPLEDHSVTKIVTNLPWGLRFGTHGENRRLYRRMLAEFRRVIVRGGRIVLLTGERALMRELVAERAVAPERVLKVSILGVIAEVYVCGA
ncbi:MAG TPA: methyltransferase domain-containing protein, partial [Candidatus Binataceae bacterium]|nr:methyltransferase domain-containing protein [Candidatus Binataceae bacterium]